MSKNRLHMANRKVIFSSSSSSRTAGIAAAIGLLLQQRSMIGRRCASFNIRHQPFAAMPSIIVDVNVAVALAAAAAAAGMQRCQPKAQSRTAYLLASCQTKLWLWILWRPMSGRPYQPATAGRQQRCPSHRDYANCMQPEDVYIQHIVTDGKNLLRCRDDVPPIFCAVLRVAEHHCSYDGNSSSDNDRVRLGYSQ